MAQGDLIGLLDESQLTESGAVGYVAMFEGGGNWPFIKIKGRDPTRSECALILAQCDRRLRDLTGKANTLESQMRALSQRIEKIDQLRAKVQKTMEKLP